MNISAGGDLASSFRLRYQNLDLKSRAATLGAELASGRSADVAKKLGGGLDQLGSVQRSVSMAESYLLATTEMLNHSASQQFALESAKGYAETAVSKLLAVRTTPTETSINTVAAAAHESFTSVVGALNRQMAGRSLFAGTATDAAALISADDMLDDLQTLTSGATTAAQVIQAVDDYFNQPGGGFESSAYLGNTASTGPVKISETERAELNATASDPRLRALMQGLATAAIMDLGALAGDNDARADLVSAAGEATLAAVGGVIGMQAEIGLVEERLQTVAARTGAQNTANQIILSEMVAVDGYETAMRLRDVETRLEALYISTSRLAQLSLVRFLR